MRPYSERCFRASGMGFPRAGWWDGNQGHFEAAGYGEPVRLMEGS